MPGTLTGPQIMDVLMAEGTKYDQEKTRVELINYGFVEGIARVMTFGAQKYDAWNWSKGISYSRVFAALLRHLFAWYRGEKFDPETGESHLYHAGCCLMFLASYEEWNRVDLDDRALPDLVAHRFNPNGDVPLGVDTLPTSDA